MKKAISLILSAITIICTFTFAPVSIKAEEKVNIEKERAVLTYLGMLPKDEIDYSKKITRAEFVDYMAKFYGTVPMSETRYYKDVPADYWAVSSINYLVEAGLLSIGDDRMFNPERIITLSEACKIMLYASGYGVLADYSGGYTQGVMNLAYSNDIVPKNIENANELTVGDAIKIIFNGITIPAYEQLGGEYDVNKNDNLLRKYRDVFINDGVVTAVYGASLNDVLPLAQNEVAIDNEKYFLNEGVNPEDKFADFVEFIYQLDDNEDKHIIYVEKIERKNDDLVISYENIYEFDNNSYTVTYVRENGTSTKNISFSKGIKIIYNGSLYQGSISKIFEDFIDKKARGTVKFKKNSSSEYDTLIVKSYRNINIGYINSELTEFNNKYNIADLINLEEYEAVRICDADGTPVKLTATLPQAVSVAASEDKKYIEIVPCTKTVSGKIEAISEETVTIADEEYYVDNTLSQNVSIVIGQNNKMYLDKFGYIVMIEADKNAFKIGYLTKISHNPEEEQLDFKIYGTDGKMATHQTAKKITIDKKKYSIEDVERILMAIPDETGVPGTFYSAVDGGYSIKVARQVIRYRLNSESEIIELDTFYCSSEEDPKTTLTRDLDGTTKLTYYHGPLSFGMSTLYYRGSTVCFTVPTVNADGKIDLNGRLVNDSESLYSPSVQISHDKSYAIESYNFNPDTVYADILVNREVSVVDDWKTFIVDTNITEYIESIDEVVHTLTGYQKGAKVSFSVNVDIDVSGINCGDILKISTNSAGNEIVGYTKIFDIQSKTFTNQTSNNDYWFVTNTGSKIPSYSYFRSSEYNLIKAYVDKKDAANFMRLTYEKGKDEGISIYGGYPVVIYDSETGKLKIGSGADIKSYQQYGGACSHILLAFSKAAIDYIYIYE